MQGLELCPVVEHQPKEFEKPSQQQSEVVYFQDMPRGTELAADIFCTTLHAMLLCRCCYTPSLSPILAENNEPSVPIGAENWLGCVPAGTHEQTKRSVLPNILGAKLPRCFGRRPFWVSGSTLEKLASFSLRCPGLWIV